MKKRVKVIVKEDMKIAQELTELFTPIFLREDIAEAKLTFSETQIISNNILEHLDRIHQ